MKRKTNIILIGMPAAGKSTVGVLLAKALNKHFIDTDIYIQQKEGKPLQVLLDEVGHDDFCRLEQDYILRLQCCDTVIATGGSVPYGEKAMEHLKADGVVVYLYLPIDEIKHRLTNLSTRGVVIDKGQSLDELYNRRAVLYDKYADVKVDATGLTHEQTIDAIAGMLRQNDNDESNRGLV